VQHLKAISLYTGIGGLDYGFDIEEYHAFFENAQRFDDETTINP
jgi:site-specific DNA-cytosine methylase